MESFFYVFTYNILEAAFQYSFAKKIEVNNEFHYRIDFERKKVNKSLDNNFPSDMSAFQNRMVNFNEGLNNFSHMEILKNQGIFSYYGIQKSNSIVLKNNINDESQILIFSQSNTWIQQQVLTAGDIIFGTYNTFSENTSSQVSIPVILIESTKKLDSKLLIVIRDFLRENQMAMVKNPINNIIKIFSETQSEADNRHKAGALNKENHFIKYLPFESNSKELFKKTKCKIGRYYVKLLEDRHSMFLFSFLLSILTGYLVSFTAFFATDDNTITTLFLISGSMALFSCIVLLLRIRLIESLQNIFFSEKYIIDRNNKTFAMFFYLTSGFLGFSKKEIFDVNFLPRQEFEDILKDKPEIKNTISKDTEEKLKLYLSDKKTFKYYKLRLLFKNLLYRLTILFSFAILGLSIYFIIYFI